MYRLKTITQAYAYKRSFNIITQGKTVFNLLPKLKSFSSVNTNPGDKVSQGPDSDDTHSDFKPKQKHTITDENVLPMIDEWVKSNDVLIFMKGTREMPRCGFSNYVVQILNFYGIKDIKVINILENNIVRETVKKYSNWPTYPQLYIKGSLVGGCDIIREMHENGTFEELLQREGVPFNKK